MKTPYPKEDCIEYVSERVIFKVWKTHCKILEKEGASWCELEQTFPIPSADLSQLSGHLEEYIAEDRDSDLKLVLTGARSFGDAMTQAA